MDDDALKRVTATVARLTALADDFRRETGRSPAIAFVSVSDFVDFHAVGLLPKGMDVKCDPGIDGTPTGSEERVCGFAPRPLSAPRPPSRTVGDPTTTEMAEIERRRA